MRFMDAFDRSLQPRHGGPGKLTKAQALRAAQRAFLDDPQTRHPYYWAPFVLHGDWGR
jgi:CHAT domain-containing protein